MEKDIPHYYPPPLLSKRAGWQMTPTVAVGSQSHGPYHQWSPSSSPRDSSKKSALHLFSAFLSVISGFPASDCPASLKHGAEWLPLLQLGDSALPWAFVRPSHCLVWNAFPCGNKGWNSSISLNDVFTAPGPPLLSWAMWELAWEANHPLISITLECVINSSEMICKEALEHAGQVWVSIFGLITSPPTEAV